MYLTLMEFLTNYFTPVGNNKFPLTTYTDIEKLMKLNFPKLIIFIYKKISIIKKRSIPKGKTLKPQEQAIQKRRKNKSILT